MDDYKCIICGRLGARCRVTPKRSYNKGKSIFFHEQCYLEEQKEVKGYNNQLHQRDINEVNK